MTDYQTLKSAATALCMDFAAEQDALNLLSHFSALGSPIVFEHGLPCLAPFIGREYKGASEIKQYFELLSEQLSFRNMVFEEYVVDTQQLKVSVKGRGRFIWVNTGEAWNETFTYLLDFVEEAPGVFKVRGYQVWADSGAAYLARNGKLKECLAIATGRRGTF